jgi:sarcosine oxidase, subunit gamma
VTAIHRSAIDELHGALERASAVTGGGLTVRERPFDIHLSLRMEPLSAAAVEACLGTRVPREPGTFAAGAATIASLGPDEWLVIAPPGAGLETELRATLTGSRDAVVDVSDQRTTFELSGPRARDVLATGCSIDLHPTVFGPGRCAETLLARAGVILLAVDDAPTFHLLARRSYAAYVTAWLLDAMIELGDGRGTA